MRTAAALELTIGTLRARFDDAAAERMLSHLVRVLEQIGASDASMRLEAITLLDPDERRQLLETWNDTD